MDCARTRRFKDLQALGFSYQDALRQVGHETDRAILRAYRDGALLKDVAKALGVSPTRVGQMRDRALKREARETRGDRPMEPLKALSNTVEVNMDLRRLARL